MHIGDDSIIFLLFSSMHSADNGFDKEFISTGGFEDHLAESAPIGFHDSIDEFNLEQSCLNRLKSQREKVPHH